MLRTSADLKSLTTIAYGAFFAVAAATASPAHPFANVAAFVLSHRSSSNVACAGLGTLPGGPQVKSSEKSSAQLHSRPGGNAGGATEDLVEDHPGGPCASWRTSGLWPTPLEPGVAIDLHRDGPGPPCMVCDREGCRQRVGGRPVPTRMIAATVTVSDNMHYFHR